MITHMNYLKNKISSSPGSTISPLHNMAFMQANTISHLENLLLEKDQMIATRDQRIQLLLRQQYCSSSEKLKLAENGQLNLFDEISAPTPEEPAPETTLVPAHERKKKGGGRRALPAGFTTHPSRVSLGRR